MSCRLWEIHFKESFCTLFRVCLYDVNTKKKAVCFVQTAFLFVGCNDELSNFIRDFRKIAEFIKHYPWLGL